MLAAGVADGPEVSEVFWGSAGVASNKLSVSCSEGIMSGGVVVVVVVEEHQHLLLTSFAVLDVLVPYHKDLRQFRVFLRVTL